MSKENKDSLEEKWLWTSKCCEDVIEHLSRENISHKNIQNNPTWHIYPHVAIWPIRDKANPDSVTWWATSGDSVLVDYVSAIDFPTPRLALIELASQWHEHAAQILEDGKDNPSEIFFEDISYEGMAAQINSTADNAIKFSYEPGIWNRDEEPKPIKKISISTDSESAFTKFFDHAKKWGSEYQIEIGVAEMALGAALIAWGAHSNVFELGKDIVATAFPNNTLAETVGAASAGAGGLGGYILGSIGVAAMGSAIGIPAGVVALGAAAIFGAMGYTITDVINDKLTQIDFNELLGGLVGASALAVGLALLIDGARRVVTDPRILEVAAKLEDGAIYLSELTVQVVAKTMQELDKFMKENNGYTISGMVGGGAAGLAIGSTLAASSVTVLGSQALGGVALSLGLVSAPLWPVIAVGVAGAAAIGAVIHYTTKNKPLDKDKT